MKHHPEQREDEIYMGNTTRRDLHKSSWRTSRLGDTALMRCGTPLQQGATDDVERHAYPQFDGGRLFPWFILRKEVEDAIHAKRVAQGPGWEESVRVYESMLQASTVFAPQQPKEARS